MYILIPWKDMILGRVGEEVIEPFIKIWVDRGTALCCPVEDLVVVFGEGAVAEGVDPVGHALLRFLDFNLSVVVQLVKLGVGERSLVEDGTAGFEEYVSGETM